MKSVSPDPERKDVGAGVFDEVSQLKFNKNFNPVLPGWSTEFLLLSILDHSGQRLVSLPQLVDITRD